MSYGNRFRDAAAHSGRGSSGSGVEGLAPGKRTLTEMIQLKAEPTVPAKPPAGAAAAQTPGRAGGGTALPVDLRAKMEAAFGADFSSVRVHQDDQAQQVGALAFTRGSDIHFAPGAYQPTTQSGQELIGHELTHVVQQSAGRVSSPSQAKDLAVNADDALEREADDLGARAARGAPAGGAGASVVVGAGNSGVAQAYRANRKERNELTRQISSYWGKDLEKEGTSVDDLVTELVEECDSHRQAMLIVENRSYQEWCTKPGTAGALHNEILGIGRDDSGPKTSTQDPQAEVKKQRTEVRKQIQNRRLDVSKFTDDDLDAIYRDKATDGWSEAIQAAYTRITEAEQHQMLRAQLLARYSVAKEAGDAIFNAGLVKAVWQLSYNIATSPSVNINTEVAGEYEDDELIEAADAWHRSANLDGQVTNFHVPGYPGVIEDKSTRTTNPDPNRGRQTDFIAKWGGNKINVHANARKKH